MHVVLDAQNSFGAYLRNSFLVCVKLTGNGGFEYNPVLSAQELEGWEPNQTEEELAISTCQEILRD